nr:MAG TPA: hypothetical protein [Caudoviricetes sp.]
MALFQNLALQWALIIVYTISHKRAKFFAIVIIPCFSYDVNRDIIIYLLIFYEY